MSFSPSLLTPPLVGGVDMSLADIEDGLPVEGVGQNPRKRGLSKSGGSLYNYIKVLAKLNASEALDKLRLAIEKNVGSIDEKNSKGSTALHACGYLKRWDFAEQLLRAGADPSLRNAAGHSFFLTAVRTPGCPWEALFVGYPELVERHRRYVSRTSSNACSELGGDAFVSGGGDSVQANVQSIVSPQSHEKVISSVDSGDWDWVDEVASGVVLPKISGEFSSRLPNEVLLKMLAKGWVFDQVDANDLLRVHSNGYQVILPMCSHEVQIDRLHDDMESGDFLKVLACAKGGAWVDQALIEYAEELGEYELADQLIEIEARQVQVTTIQARAVDAKAIHKHQKKSSVANKLRKSKPNRRSGGGKPGRPGRVSKIANLDGPQREANEFEYREKSPVKVPIIIVKKARILRESD